MKDFKGAKNLQLFAMLLLTGAIVVLIFKNRELYHLIATDLEAGKMFMLIWLLIAVCFGFLIYDFVIYAHLKRKYGEIDMAMYSDPLTGIGNRSSLDAFIDEYSNKDLPIGVASVAFIITNLGEINKSYGNAEGDSIIKDFSNILADTGKGRCFVGRNGGNNFLSLFRDAKQEDIVEFIADVAKATEKRNENAMGAKITYKFGTAIHNANDQLTITELVGLSYRNAVDKNEDNI